MTKSDDIIVARGRGSIPPPEPTVTEEIREFLAKEDENDEYYSYRLSTPPPPPLKTPFKEVVMRAYGTGPS